MHDKVEWFMCKSLSWYLASASSQHPCCCLCMVAPTVLRRVHLYHYITTIDEPGLGQAQHYVRIVLNDAG